MVFSFPSEDVDTCQNHPAFRSSLVATHNARYLAATCGLLGHLVRLFLCCEVYNKSLHWKRGNCALACRGKEIETDARTYNTSDFSYSATAFSPGYNSICRPQASAQGLPMATIIYKCSVHACASNSVGLVNLCLMIT